MFVCSIYNCDVKRKGNAEKNETAKTFMYQMFTLTIALKRTLISLQEHEKNIFERYFPTVDLSKRC